MKNLILLIFVGVCFSCTPSPEKKAQELIKTNLSKTMQDWNSYEAVEFGKLDSTFTTFQDDKKWKGYYLYQQLFEGKSDRLHKLADSEENPKKKIQILDSALNALSVSERYLDSLHAFQKNFKGEFNGWKMIHTYRGNNSLGAKIIAKTVFYFDKDITGVTGSKNMND